MPSHFPRQATTLLAVSLLAASLQAADDLVPRRTASTLAAPLLTVAPKIDGDLSEAAWKGAQPLRDFAFTKGVRFQTEGWIARDATNFYIAARCFDDNLKEIVTANEGSALWKNDCIELFIVPEKDALFFAHVILACNGTSGGSTWVKDEWGEPTAGKGVAITCVAGREKNAWTVEAAIPIAAFGYAIDPKRVWAIGFNREKQNKPTEVSSFQGGFNKPTQYPNLVFDNRTVLVDGLGLRNTGSAPQNVQVTFQAKTEGAAPGKALSLTLPPGERVALPWKEQVGSLKSGDAFAVQTADANGKPLVTEEYKLVEAARSETAIDLSKIPPAKFVKTPFDDPAFFPIAVWLQPAGAAKDFKAMGVNTYVGGIDSYPNPRGKAFLDAIQAQGMIGIVPFTNEHLEAKLQEHPAFVAWMHGDEPDNSNPATGQVNHTPEELTAVFARARSVDPAHRMYLNLGCGVGEERSGARAATDAQYRNYPKACDIICFDVYPCNSVEPDGPNRFHLIAKGMDRLRQWNGPDRQSWAWIEVNKFSKDESGRAPTTDEVKTQIWMALVHGANGYGFFCHSWSKEWLKENLGGKDMKSSVTAIAKPMREALTVINAEVTALAPVLNSPTIANGAKVAVAQGGRVDTLTKAKDGATYVFAVNMYRKPEQATITVAGAADGVAEVLYENRTVPVKGGAIRDEFASYAVHRYKITATGAK